MLSGVTPFESTPDVKESVSGGDSPKSFPAASPPSSTVTQPVPVAKPRSTHPSKLTLKQRTFVNALTNPKHKAFLNQTQAYKTASPGVTYATAQVGGCENLTKPIVRDAVMKQLLKLGGREELEGEVKWNLDTAREKGKLPDHLNATQLALKLGGHLIDRQEVKHISDEERESIRRLVSEALPN